MCYARKCNPRRTMVSVRQMYWNSRDVCGWNFVQKTKNNNPSSYDFFPEETEHGIRIVGILSLPHGKSTIWDIATNPDIDIMPLKVGSCNNDSGQSNIYEYIESIICLQ